VKTAEQFVELVAFLKRIFTILLTIARTIIRLQKMEQMLNLYGPLEHESSVLFTDDDVGVFSPWSLVHFSSGAVASRYVSLPMWILIHQIWEIMEQTPLVSNAFRTVGYPEYSGDTATNSAGDTLSTLMGYVVGTAVNHRHTLLSSNSTLVIILWVLEAAAICVFAMALANRISFDASAMAVYVLFFSMLLWVIYTDSKYPSIL